MKKNNTSNGCHTKNEKDLIDQIISESRYVLSEAILSSAVHEIKNLIHQSRGRIKRQLYDEKKRKNRITIETLTNVDSDLAQALDRIQGVYRIFRNDRQESPPFCHVNKEIKNTLYLWSTYLNNKKCKIKLDLTALNDRVELEPTHLHEIISVLIVNSVQANSTKIKISSYNKENLKVSEICNYSNAIQVCFSDNGYGVTIGNQDKLFKAGYTTKQTNPGFGLYVARTIARRARGELSYAGQSNNIGADFFISIPLMEDKL